MFRQPYQKNEALTCGLIRKPSMGLFDEAYQTEGEKKIPFKPKVSLKAHSNSRRKTTKTLDACGSSGKPALWKRRSPDSVHAFPNEKENLRTQQLKIAINPSSHLRTTVQEEYQCSSYKPEEEKVFGENLNSNVWQIYKKETDVSKKPIKKVVTRFTYGIPASKQEKRQQLLSKIPSMTTTMDLSEDLHVKKESFNVWNNIDIEPHRPKMLGTEGCISLHEYAETKELNQTIIDDDQSQFSQVIQGHRDLPENIKSPFLKRLLESEVQKK